MNLKVTLAAAGLLVAGAALAVLCAPAGCPAAPPEAAPLPAPAAAADEPPQQQQQQSREPQQVHRVTGAHVRDIDTTFEWGAIPAETTFKHVFVLHNDGDAALHIVRTRPS